MSTPLVSVVVPSYNKPKETQRAINSVAQQTYEPIELVVVDDGSDPPISSEISLHSDTFLKTTLRRHETNQGGNVARNTGIDAASGKYIAFLDSDDTWHPKKLQSQISRLEESNERLASYTGIKYVDYNGKLNSIYTPDHTGYLTDDLLQGNIIGTFSSVIVDRQVFEKVGHPHPDLPSWQDWEWYLRLAPHVKFDVVSDPLTIKHEASNQISGSYYPKKTISYPVIYNQIQSVTTSEHQFRIGKGYLNYELGRSALSNNEYAEARRCFFRAIENYPYEVNFYKYFMATGPHYPKFTRMKRCFTRLSSN